MPRRENCEFMDLQLVWGFTSEDSSVRTLCFWDIKHKTAFDDRNFRSKGGMAHFNYYEPFVGDYPKWAEVAKQKLKSQLELPDSHNWCWKFSHEGETGYSECTCGIPKEVPSRLLFIERLKIWDGVSPFPDSEDLGITKLQELKDYYNKYRGV